MKTKALIGAAAALLLAACDKPSGSTLGGPVAETGGSAETGGGGPAANWTPAPGDWTQWGRDSSKNMVAPDAVFSEGKYKSGLWELVGEDRMQARGISETELHEYYRNRNLLKAAVTGRHVANAVLFFVMRQTPTTGGTIPVDGGLPDATPR